MAAASLFEEGWHQGSLLDETMTVQTNDFVDGSLSTVDHEFRTWILTTQDCDLYQTKCTNATRQFELRPVFPDDGAKVDGIRNRVIRIGKNQTLRADCARLMLTARALNALKTKRDNSLDEVVCRELKTWLGLRYDRPAIPMPFDELTREVLYPTLYDNMPAALIGKVRDVLVYYDSAKSIRLFAILREAHDRNVCLDWIDDVAQSLIAEHGIGIAERQAESAAGTPLSILEKYYALDAAELSSTQDQV